MSRSSFLAAAWLFLVVLPTAAAQVTLRGTVRDARTAEALPAAHIVVDGRYQGTVTNAEGEYALRADALPVTLVVRFIGYATARRTVAPGDPLTQDFRLQPTTYALDEVVVTDEDPALNIMRKVIERKQAWTAGLETWQAEAYTRFTARNDTGIVAIVESVSEAFWDRDRGFREVAKGKRQTENLDFEDLLPAAVFVQNLYGDDIEMAGYTFIGPTHPEALRHYRFTLEGLRELDGQVVYDIAVVPKNRLKTAFVGRVAVLDSAYALLEVELRPNESFLFPMPIRDYRVTYAQQFSNYGGDYWLPADFRSRGELEIGFPGLQFPTITFDQISRLSGYDVNVPLPDSLYEDDRLLRVDSAAVASGRAITEIIEIVPLSVEESEAYATIDSTLTLEKAYEPTGPLARFARADASADGNGGEGSAGIGGRLPSFSPRIWYNRVDAAHLGLEATVRRGPLAVSGELGYATGTEDWTYGAGAVVRFGPRRAGRLAVDYRAGSDLRYDSPHYGRILNSLVALAGQPDYFDYFRNEGWRVEAGHRVRPLRSRIAVRFRDERHGGLVRTTSYDLAGRNSLQRFNPVVDEGRLRSLGLVWSVGEDFVPVTGNRRIELSVEHAPAGWGDMAFTHGRMVVDGRVPTFFRRRLLPNALDVRVVAGLSRGNLPPQRFGTLDASLWGYSPFGAFRTLRDRPYEGERYVGVFWEHHFRTVPFELLGWRGPARRGVGISLHGAHGSTHVSRETRQRLDFSTRTPRGFRHEVGLSVNGLLGLPLRFGFTKRLDARGYAVGFGLARWF